VSDETYKTVGELPICFTHDMDGEVGVVAACNASPNFPEARVWMFVGCPALKSEDGICAALTVDQADDLIARLTKAKELVLDAADSEVVQDDDGVQLLKSSLGRWGVQEGAGDLVWFTTEKAAREHLEYVGDLAMCECCEERFPIDDMVSSGDCYLCEECAEVSREEARQHQARHSDPTECDWVGTIADCDFEDNNILCPKCQGEIEYGDKVEASAAAPAPEAAPPDDDVTEDTRG
jgi:hypothetical protein